MQSRFTGVWIPIITPFLGDSIDREALARLAKHFELQGVAGLVVGATTGEGVLLQEHEQEALIATLSERVPKLPLVLGVTTSSTAAAVTRAKTLARMRPTGLLLTPPVYVRPSQDGIRRHFEEVVDATDLPVLVYNIPYRTGCNVELDTLKKLSTDPRIAGIKECGGSNERTLRLVHETPLSVLSGDDAQNFSALCLGAHGIIAASAHVRPDLHIRMQKLIDRGDIAGARRIAVALQPITATLFAEPSPAPLKALLASQGWCEPELRLPFVPASEEIRQRLKTDWDSLVSKGI